jgi:hypothetical protein
MTTLSGRARALDRSDLRDVDRIPPRNTSFSDSRNVLIRSSYFSIAAIMNKRFRLSFTCLLGIYDGSLHSVDHRAVNALVFPVVLSRSCALKKTTCVLFLCGQKKKNEEE